MIWYDYRRGNVTCFSTGSIIKDGPDERVSQSLLSMATGGMRDDGEVTNHWRCLDIEVFIFIFICVFLFYFLTCGVFMCM